MAILGQFRGDLLSEWERVNPVIHDREFVLVKESVNGPWTAYKVGDGVNKFSDLPYGSNISVLQSLGDSETGVMSQKAVTDALNTYNLMTSKGGSLLIHFLKLLLPFPMLLEKQG